MEDTFVAKCTHCGQRANLGDILFRGASEGIRIERGRIYDTPNKIKCLNCGNWEQEDMHKYSE